MRKEFVRQLAAALLNISLFAAPAVALAQTTDTTTSEIQTIKEQIKSYLDKIEALKNRLMTLTDGGTASSTPKGLLRPCPTPTRNLGLGSEGKDVSELQQFLAQDSSLYPEGLVTGFFGPKTAQAVARLQMRHGIASTTTGGSVGPLTRGFFGKRCGEILGLGHFKDHVGSSTASTTRRGPKPPHEHPGQGSGEEQEVE